MYKLIKEHKVGKKFVVAECWTYLDVQMLMLYHLVRLFLRCIDVCQSLGQWSTLNALFEFIIGGWDKQLKIRNVFNTTLNKKHDSIMIVPISTDSYYTHCTNSGKQLTDIRLLNRISSYFFTFSFSDKVQHVQQPRLGFLRVEFYEKIKMRWENKKKTIRLVPTR